MNSNLISLMNLDADSWQVNRDRNVNPDDQRFKEDNMRNDFLTWPQEGRGQSVPPPINEPPVNSGIVGDDNTIDP